MALDPTKVKEELTTLRERKAVIERRIQGLEIYIGKTNGSSTERISARGGIDIRPTVKAIFADNSNQPIKYKDLVDKVAEKHPDSEYAVIQAKMIHVTRTILEKTGYGMYHLKKTEPQKPAGALT